VHRFSLPLTPQHNAVAERGMREIKEATPLGAGPVLEPLEEACLALNERARPSRGGSSARDLDRILPHWNSRRSRENFNQTAQEATEQALAAAPSMRAQRSFVREAIYKTLELFDLVKRTRGERPLPGPNSEGER